ncbi:hypothetical protein [Prosthecobacter dejongeii]|uniref:Uncharacterized protein n=1 Tax=Prosthecobacter dejongeii TaxID=48465 RepID=A0A7W7YIQ2_9BACT|nr:hypothetical protein [Prosthecobacter dejongeii]MBB5036884.1 hypothetical protein [Prosthecobacter dejongeii]
MKATRRSAGLLLLLYTALVAVWVLRLAPPSNKNVVAEESTSQERQEKIAAYLAKAPKDTAMPALMRLMRLPEDQLQALSDWVNLPAISQVRQLTVQQAPISKLGPEWGEALLQTLLGHARPMNLMEAHLMIAASGDRLRDEARLEALQALARKALAQGDSADATTILGRACELPSANWETLQTLAQACRRGNHPAPALKALQIWIQRNVDGPDSALEEARDLELSLMLDADLTAEALSLQLSHLTGKAPYPERALDRTFLAARRAHQGSRFLPILERHLQSFPEHVVEASKLAFQSQVNADYLRWLSAHAAICDDEQPGAFAFQSYLRLAAARVPHALPRLCALATTSALKAQAEQALALALERPEMQLTFLQLAQTDAIAKKVLATKLRLSPHNRELHFTATLAAVTHQNNASTAILWQEFLHRFPGDISGQRRLIQAYIQEGQPALALRAYAAIPTKALTEEDQRQQEILRQL